MNHTISGSNKLLAASTLGLFVLVGVARAVGGDDGGVGGAGGDRGFGGVAEMGGFTSSSILLECQNDICTVPIPVEVSEGQVSVTACEGHLIKVDVEPISQSQGCSALSLVDLTETEFDSIFFYSDENTEEKSLYSVSNEIAVRFGWDGNLECGFNVSVSCAPNVTSDASAEYGADSLFLDLSPNTRHTVSLTSSNIHNISLNTTLDSPLAGYTLVSLDGDEEEQVMILGSIPSALLAPRRNISKIQVVTFGQSQEQGEVAWELGDPPTTTSTTTTTTTTTTPLRELVYLFVLGVNEPNFQAEYSSHIAQTVNETLYRACEFENYPPTVEISMVSCRSTCSMTDDPDRGCAKVAIDVYGIPPSTRCDLGGLTTIQYVREDLMSRLEELEKDYGASKVYVDRCNEIELSSPWIIISIGIVAGTVILVSVIFWMVSMKKSFLRGSKKSHGGSQTSLIGKSHRQDHWETLN